MALNNAENSEEYKYQNKTLTEYCGSVSVVFYVPWQQCTVAVLRGAVISPVFNPVGDCNFTSPLFLLRVVFFCVWCFGRDN